MQQSRPRAPPIKLLNSSASLPTGSNTPHYDGQPRQLLSKSIGKTNPLCRPMGLPDIHTRLCEKLPIVVDGLSTSPVRKTSHSPSTPHRPSPWSRQTRAPLKNSRLLRTTPIAASPSSAPLFRPRETPISSRSSRHRGKFYGRFKPPTKPRLRLHVARSHQRIKALSASPAAEDGIRGFHRR